MIYMFLQLLTLLVGLLNLMLVLIAAMCYACHAILVVLEAHAVRVSSVPMWLTRDLLGCGTRVLADLDVPGDLRHV